MSHHKRVGFTLVELLVVISIIGMLMALLLPAVNGARARMRQATCLNNVRSLGQAVQNHLSAKDEYPGYLQRVKDGGVQGSEQLSWAAVLLPRLDRQDLWDAIREPGPAGLYPQTGPEPGLFHTRVEVFVCPADVKSAPDFGWLSFVANTGAWDNRSAYGNTRVAPDFKENGVFHNQLLPNAPRLKQSDVHDGLSTTLLFSENNHKIDDEIGQNGKPLRSVFGGWMYNSWGEDVYFDGSEQQFGMVWIYDGSNDSSGQSAWPRDQLAISRVDDSIDGIRPTSPLYARPASNHVGGVNVIFCDGSGRFLSEDISYNVYQRLMTPHGAKCRDPWNPDGKFQQNGIHIFYNKPPLSEAELD